MWLEFLISHLQSIGLKLQLKSLTLPTQHSRIKISLGIWDHSVVRWWCRWCWRDGDVMIMNMMLGWGANVFTRYRKQEKPKVQGNFHFSSYRILHNAPRPLANHHQQTQYNFLSGHEKKCIVSRLENSIILDCHLSLEFSGYVFHLVLWLTPQIETKWSLLLPQKKKNWLYCLMNQMCENAKQLQKIFPHPSRPCPQLCASLLKIWRHSQWLAKQINQMWQTL